MAMNVEKKPATEKKKKVAEAAAAPRRDRKKPASLLDETPREHKVQFNVLVDASIKSEFQIYCAKINKTNKTGQVFADVWNFYKKHHDV